LKSAPQPPAEELEANIPKQLILLTAVLIAEGAVLLEDVWPHLATASESEEAIDEVEHLVQRQIKLVQFKYYKNAFENIVNMEEFERTELRQRV
jgi:hypothetical protein